jgi:hypothetical protein
MKPSDIKTFVETIITALSIEKKDLHLFLTFKMNNDYFNINSLSSLYQWHKITNFSVMINNDYFIHFSGNDNHFDDEITITYFEEGMFTDTNQSTYINFINDKFFEYLTTDTFSNLINKTYIKNKVQEF